MLFLFDSNAIVNGENYDLKVHKLHVEPDYQCFGIAIESSKIKPENENQNYCFFEMWGFRLDETKEEVQEYFESSSKGDAIAELCLHLNLPYSNYESALIENNFSDFYYEGYKW